MDEKKLNMEKIIPNTAPDSMVMVKKELNDINSLKNNIDPFEKLKKLEERIASENKKIYVLDDKLIEMDNNYKSQKKLTISQKIEVTKRQKLLEVLTSKNKSLSKQLNSLINKQAKLETEYFDFDTNKSNPNNGKLRDIKQKKEHIQKSINCINEQIQKIYDTEKSINKKELIKNYVENIENIIERERTALPLINKRKSKKGTKSYTQIIKNLEEQEKKSQEMLNQERKNKLKILREKELKIRHDRKNNIKILIDNLDKSKINESSIFPNKKTYILSEEKEKIRLQKEQDLLDFEKQRRKEYFSPISAEELNNFSNEVKKNEAKLKLDLEKKKLQMEELWKERKGLLPKYRNKFIETNAKTEIENELKQIKLKQEKIQGNYLEKINYSKELDNKPKIINEKLKEQREQIIKTLEGVDRQNEIKKLSNKLKLKSIKLIQSQPQNFSKNNVLVIKETVGEQINKKISSNNRYNNVDYLLDIRQKKINSKSTGEKTEDSIDADLRKFKENLEKKGKEKNTKKIKSSTNRKSVNKCDTKTGTDNIIENNNEKERAKNKKYFQSIEAKLKILEKYLNN